MTDPQVGQAVFRVANRLGEPVMLRANFIGRRGSWRRFRNLSTGAEWNENGQYWRASPEDAALDFIETLCLGLAVGYRLHEGDRRPQLCSYQRPRLSSSDDPGELVGLVMTAVRAFFVERRAKVER